MEKRPTKCPICGNKIVRVTNATTKNSYFKCANKSCHFVLGGEFTEAEFNLQGQTLKTGCVKCGAPLTIANGPHGLYPRCYECDCDLRPTFYNGKMYQKWVNAQRNGAKDEISKLIELGKIRNEEDELYDFEAFIASNPVKKNASTKEIIDGTIQSKILDYLKGNGGVAVSSENISRIIGAKIGSVRTSLLLLRSLDLVKVAGYNENLSGNHTLLYQTKGCNLPELKVYTAKDGYNSVMAFLRENADKYGSVVRSRETLLAALKKNEVERVLFQSSRGVCYGYKTSDMKEAMSGKKSTETPKTSVSKSKDEPTAREQIINLMKKDLTKSYTIKQLTENSTVDMSRIAYILKELRDTKKVKIVGWHREGSKGSYSLSYQLTESPLPKMKVTTDNNLYATIEQFYDKKLSGKRKTSRKKAKQEVQKLTSIPLLINQRAYVGYSIADLKEVFKDCLGSSTTKRAIVKKSLTTSKKVTIEKPLPIEVQAATLVSNPLPKKKSFMGAIKSFFKKDKVLS